MLRLSISDHEVGIPVCSDSAMKSVAMEVTLKWIELCEVAIQGGDRVV